MEQVRKALSRSKTAFEKVQKHRRITDHLLNEDELSPGREIYEIELALDELEQRLESCPVDAVVSGTWVDAKTKPKEEVILLTSSKEQVIGDWYKGVWRTYDSYFENKELKSIYAEEDIIAWTPKPEITDKYH